MIDGIFVPQAAMLIKTIPLARAELEDIVFWPLAKDGKYTYKFGYHFLKEEADLEQHEDYEIQDKQLWKGIWMLHVPNKVKNVIGEHAETCCLQKQIWFIEQ